MEKITSYAESRPGYRADIDGLRAIAVLGVLLFHINPAAMPGGYLGVDVFFVISGFLITGIIERARLRGEFSFVDFYERRIRRIIPALYVMMAITLILSALKLWPGEFEAFGKSLKYVSISMGNFEFLDKVEDYFNEESNRVPLLHTWSLAVEEQFYFIFPILLLGMGKFVKRKGTQLGVLAFMFSVSFAACLWRSEQAPMSAFFMLQYRAWELLAGALLAIVMPSAPGWMKGGRWPELLGWMGLLTIGAGFVVCNGSETPQGIAGMVACVGAVLLIFSGEGGKTFVARLIGRRWMVGIGVISYSLYLWHWPVAVFCQGENGGMGWLKGSAVFLVALILGWASWRWVERPFRAPKQGHRKWVFISWAVLTLGFVLCSNYIRKNNGLPGRFPEEVERMLEYGEKVGGVGTKDHYDVEAAPIFGKIGSPPAVAIWGDSHAEALIPGVEAAALERGGSFRAYVLSAQPPVSGVVPVQNRVKRRAAYNEAVFQKLLSDETIETVILAARWSNPILGKNEDINPRPRDFYMQDFKDNAQKQKFYTDRIAETIRKLHEAGKRVFLVDPVPELGRNVPLTLAQLLYENKPLVKTLPCRDYQIRNSVVLGVFDELEKKGLVTRIRPQKELLVDGEVKILQDGVPIYRDDDHLSQGGARSLNQLFLEAFAGAENPASE